jgi:hypothetical protein
MSAGQLGRPASIDAPAPSMSVNRCAAAASAISRLSGGWAKAAKLTTASSWSDRRYTHALPDYLERARKQFDRYLADEMKLAATG